MIELIGGKKNYKNNKIACNSNVLILELQAIYLRIYDILLALVELMYNEQLNEGSMF